MRLNTSKIKVCVVSGNNNTLLNFQKNGFRIQINYLGTQISKN